MKTLILGLFFMFIVQIATAVLAPLLKEVQISRVPAEITTAELASQMMVRLSFRGPGVFRELVAIYLGGGRFLVPNDPAFLATSRASVRSTIYFQNAAPVEVSLRTLEFDEEIASLPRGSFNVTPLEQTSEKKGLLEQIPQGRYLVLNLAVQPEPVLAGKIASANLRPAQFRNYGGSQVEEVLLSRQNLRVSPVHNNIATGPVIVQTREDLAEVGGVLMSDGHIVALNTAKGSQRSYQPVRALMMCECIL